MTTGRPSSAKGKLTPKTNAKTGQFETKVDEEANAQQLLVRKDADDPFAEPEEAWVKYAKLYTHGAEIPEFLHVAGALEHNFVRYEPGEQIPTKRVSPEELAWLMKARVLLYASEVVDPAKIAAQIAEKDDLIATQQAEIARLMASLGQ